MRWGFQKPLNVIVFQGGGDGRGYRNIYKTLIYIVKADVYYRTVLYITDLRSQEAAANTEYAVRMSKAIATATAVQQAPQYLQGA